MCISSSFQNIIKTARKGRLTRLIKANKVVNELVGCICALPLLPEDSMIKGYIWVLKRAQKKGIYDRLCSLLVYVWQTWICAEGDIISVYRCPARTSNVCESDNASLKAFLRLKHPAVWALLGKSLHFVSLIGMSSDTQFNC